MNPEQYAGWVDLHCEATGADARARTALLSDVVRGVLVEHGGATPEELGEVTFRLVARRETPKFGNEHADAVGAELVRLREERRAAALPPPAAAPGNFAPDCPACDGSGLAVVPVPECVAGGRLVPNRGRLLTCAVVCDRPGCAAGGRAAADNAGRKNRLPLLSAAELRTGARDLPGLIRRWERDRADHNRRFLPPGGGFDFPALAAILARSRQKPA